MKSYKEILTRIEELVSKIEKADLSLDELFEMERLTAKLHERSIILRYKAFENKLGVTKAVVTDEPEISLNVEVIEEPKQEPVVEVQIEEPDEVEFALFEEESEEVEMSFEESEMDSKEREPVAEEPQIIEPEVIKEEPVEVKSQSTNDSVSFLDKFQTEDNSLGHRFVESKLDTLIGAFSLNEKLRYINELFDGSSEMFSDAIKALDAKDSFTDATNLISDLAKQHEWDPEEESVSEFMVFIKRRYA